MCGDSLSPIAGKMPRRRVVIARAVASLVLSGKPRLLTIKAYGE